MKSLSGRTPGLDGSSLLFLSKGLPREALFPMSLLQNSVKISVLPSCFSLENLLLKPGVPPDAFAQELLWFQRQIPGHSRGNSLVPNGAQGSAF